MKNILIVVLLVHVLSSTHAQQNDSSISISNYVGILSTATFTRTTTTTDASFRAGASLIWHMSKKITWNSFAVLDISKGDMFSAQGHYLNYKPSKKWDVTMGQMATLSTEQRGFPVSAGGQFETWVHTQIPGATLGGKVKCHFDNNLTIGVGLARRNGVMEYHGSIDYKKFKTTGYVSKNSYGQTLSLATKRFYTLAVLNNATVGHSIVWTMFPKTEIKFWGTYGFEHRTGTLACGIGGLLKNFSYKSFSGLTAFGYDFKNKTFGIYLFVHS